jgi:hypothetical protein
MPTGVTFLSFTPSLTFALPSLLASSYEQRQNMTVQKRMLQVLQCLPLQKRIACTQQYRFVNTVNFSQNVLAQAHPPIQHLSTY